MIVDPSLTALIEALSTHEPKRYSVAVRAAVLVPIHVGPSGVQLLFTKRPDNLRAHPGQVSFPGGRIDASDANEQAAALREAHEELGIEPSDVRIIGQLDDIVTGTGFTVTPVVGVLDELPVLRPNPTEVADVFWFPLARLQQEEGWRQIDMMRDGTVFHLWFFDGAPHTIWGATAAMTRQLLALIR